MRNNQLEKAKSHVEGSTSFTNLWHCSECIPIYEKKINFYAELLAFSRLTAIDKKKVKHRIAVNWSRNWYLSCPKNEGTQFSFYAKLQSYWYWRKVSRRYARARAQLTSSKSHPRALHLQRVGCKLPFSNSCSHLVQLPENKCRGKRPYLYRTEYSRHPLGA